MGQTTGDNLRWPENGDPAMVPQDMQELATDVQTGLNKRIPAIPTAEPTMSYSSGWAQYSSGLAVRLAVFGKIVVARGLITRTANLNVTDNNDYQMGTIPAAQRPKQSARFAVPWHAADQGGTAQNSVCHVTVETTGEVRLWPNFTGVFRPGDYAGVDGAVWVTN